MDKQNIKIIYQYDGSKFFGFQRQKKLKTVQGEIEGAINKIFNVNINMISSGRTDRGVHALEQVSNFTMSSNIPIDVIKRQLNKHLNGEIKILDIEVVSNDFNSRFDAKKRAYLYVMKKEEDITPFEKNYVSLLKSDIDVEKFNEIMQVYVGKHNFVNFMKSDKSYRNPFRVIEYIDCYYNCNEGKYYVEICGNGFLKTMVRIMIGTALYVYYNGKSKDFIVEKLLSEKSEDKKILAAAEGLYLYKVEY